MGRERLETLLERGGAAISYIAGASLTALIQLSAPDGHPIWLNPGGVLELHDARPSHREHFAPGTKCLVDMSDGRTVATSEACDVVIDKLWPRRGGFDGRLGR
jgi:hypothetical protein